jgi:Ca2+-binding EF-hand superfamily protein
MTKTIITTLLATAMFAGIAAPAFAAGDDGAGRHAKRAERMIETFDADGDGSVTAIEIKDHRTATFASVDADSNGLLSQEEFDMLRQIRDAKREEARKEMTENMGAGQGMGKGMGHGKGMGKGKNGEGRGPNFGRMDANGDGSVSLAEFTANSDRMFARLDRNSDGVVTTADFQKKPGKAN